MRLTINTKKFFDCTVGRLSIEGSNFQCFTLELPDKDNQKNISCIPEGVYKAFKRFSPSKQCEVIQLKDVPNRSYIQIHVGNFTRQIKGCILVGDFVGFFDDDLIPDVGKSEFAFNHLMSITPNELEVEIIRS